MLVYVERNAVVVDGDINVQGKVSKADLVRGADCNVVVKEKWQEAPGIVHGGEAHKGDMMGCDSRIVRLTNGCVQ